MKDIDPITTAVLDQIARKAEPKMEAALARHGVSSPDQLSQEVAGKIFQDICLETAVENFPTAQLDALKHGLTAFRHARFGPAFTRLRSQMESPLDAFAMATGPDAAIVLAAFGLPVAPFDRKKLRILAPPSNDIDEVAERFSRFKTAYVGYSPCDIPFYILVTDCVQTMRSQIAVRSQLQGVKKLLERTGAELPQGPFTAFQHGIAFIAREPGDTIATICLNNPSAHEGSVALYAGWSVNGVRDGAPNEGFMPVPMQFIEAALQDPQIALWIWKPIGIRMKLN